MTSGEVQSERWHVISMRRNRPTIEFSDQHEGQGVIRQGDIGLDVPGFRLSRSKYDHGSPWRFRATVPERNAIHRFDFGSDEPFSFEGTNIYLKKIEIPRIAGPGGGPHELTGSVYEFSIGSPTIAVEDSDKVEQYCTIYMTPNEILLPKRQVVAYSADGQDIFSENDNNPLNWNSSKGVFELHSSFESEEAMTNARRARVRIPIPVANLELNKFEKEPGILAKSILDEFEVPTRLLSFLARHHIAAVRCVVLTAGTTIEEFEFHRVRRFSMRRDHFWALTPGGRLIPESLNTMIENVERLEWKDSILSSIIYLNDVYVDGFIEQHLTNSFWALETLVNGIAEAEGSDIIMKESLFRRFRDQLKPEVTAFCKEHGIDRKRRGMIYAKLKELQRSPLIPRILEIADRYGIECRDFADSKAELNSWMKKAYRRRSLLQHRGKIENFPEVIEDYHRVHALTEKIIAKVCGVREEWIAPGAYSHL